MSELTKLLGYVQQRPLTYSNEAKSTLPEKEEKRIKRKAKIEYMFISVITGLQQGFVELSWYESYLSMLHHIISFHLSACLKCF